MKLLSLIMSHKEALPIIKNHLPIWENIGGKIIFTSPKDSSLGGIENYIDVNIEWAEHHGEKSAQRIIKIFEFALEQKDWTHLLLMEYDSFALNLPEEVMPPEAGVSAARYFQNKPIKYKGRFYLHYPMLFTREGFERTLKMLPEVKTNDRYFSDRFIGRAVELAGIPVRDLIKNGKAAYSKNTILPQHYTKLKQAVRDGAIFFHGCKNQETLDIILNNK